MNIARRILMAAVMLAAAAGAQAQSFVVDPQPVSEVSGKAEGATKAEMMSRLRRWVALTFERSDVIDMQDERAGTMVLKWSAPLPQASKWLTATLSETCVIDVSDDGRWRMQVYAPRVTWATTETADVYNELGMPNQEAEADKALVSGVGRRVYEGASEWPVDDRLDEIDAAYLAQLQATTQFRNDKDRERGRATDEYRSMEHAWRIFHDVRRGVEQYKATLVQSLARSLVSGGF